VRWCLAASIVCLSLAGPARAGQQESQEAEATALEDLVVEGRTLREAVEAFVDEVTAPPPGHGPARWQQRICIGVVNLRHDAARIIIDQVSTAAEAIGLEPAAPGCSPNILVIASDDANALANTLVESKPFAFRPGYAGAAQSSEALEAFRVSEQPVRWWHVSLPVVRGSGAPAVRLPGRDAPFIPGSGRLTTEVTNRLLRSFVILDVNRMEGVSFQQVGDYIGMVALAQIDLDADTGSFDTVLNLFTDPGRVDAMTDWDRAYLASLYGSWLNQRNPNAQTGAVGSLMTRDRRAAQRETDKTGPER